jgi:hypothetical protein
MSSSIAAKDGLLESGGWKFKTLLPIWMFAEGRDMCSSIEAVAF